MTMYDGEFMEGEVVLSRNGDIPPTSAKRINKLEILPFAGLPIVAVGVGLGAFGLGGAGGGILEHLDHGVGNLLNSDGRKLS